MAHDLLRSSLTEGSLDQMKKAADRDYLEAHLKTRSTDSRSAGSILDRK
jgi:hypothetical protein